MAKKVKKEKVYDKDEFRLRRDVEKMTQLRMTDIENMSWIG